jgi:hypothetical protein
MRKHSVRTACSILLEFRRGTPGLAAAAAPVQISPPTVTKAMASLALGREATLTNRCCLASDSQNIRAGHTSRFWRRSSVAWRCSRTVDLTSPPVPMSIYWSWSRKAVDGGLATPAAGAKLSPHPVRSGGLASLPFSSARSQTSAPRQTKFFFIQTLASRRKVASPTKRCAWFETVLAVVGPLRPEPDE